MQSNSIGAHVLAVLVLPFNVTILIPLLIILFSPSNFIWGLSFPINLALAFAASGLLTAGFLLLGMSIYSFKTAGKGTLAPWHPTNKLVVDGPYRYTRNPMISGVGFILIGETLLIGSWLMLVYAASFLIINHVYFIKVEEPYLSKKFSSDYDLYKNNVPRWIPRLTPFSLKRED
ncbi:methyltransferase family protein [Alkalicoccus daliensis]|uniref:Protein-S-isoprenylcysteine O-methyltransferase Ste14 n=1 Tax=Alkalicoccus daliensis TaxID=745820 RepID=A0A1H0DS10_9BACI|nr:isoprenylcysteine carboxylmethyltransferase family protein [Alkalicoccus daliensis]SDN72761.1 Protein-S-isoprenylcysteine O-methyltransferase Ste14 [Alkalicoccus daliensis]